MEGREKCRAEYTESEGEKDEGVQRKGGDR